LIATNAKQKKIRPMESYTKYLQIVILFILDQVNVPPSTQTTKLLT